MLSREPCVLAVNSGAQGTFLVSAGCEVCVCVPLWGCVSGGMSQSCISVCCVCVGGGHPGVNGAGFHEPWPGGRQPSLESQV